MLKYQTDNIQMLWMFHVIKMKPIFARIIFLRAWLAIDN